MIRRSIENSVKDFYNEGSKEMRSSWRENVGSIIGFIKMKNNATCFYADGNDGVKRGGSVIEKRGYDVRTVMG